MKNIDLDCVFCKIVQQQIPSAKVWEDDNSLAFMSISPINPGHVLVIPKKHTDYLFDLEDKDLSDLLIASKKVAKAIKKAFDPKTGKVGVMVAGMQVPHAHIHLIPMNSESDLSFERQKAGVLDTLQKQAELLKNVLE